MVAWVLVDLLLVGLWAAPGGARQPNAEKPKPTDAQMTGLLAVLEDKCPRCKGWCLRSCPSLTGQRCDRPWNTQSIAAEVNGVNDIMGARYEWR
jgi:hypothetical protein